MSNTAETPFFDSEDSYFVTTDLWLISKTAVGIIGMIAAASAVGGGLGLADNFLVRFSGLMRVNQDLQGEFMFTRGQVLTPSCVCPSSMIGRGIPSNHG